MGMTEIRGECPHCGSFETEQVNVTWFSDHVEEIRICNDCPTQYTLDYGPSVIIDERQVGEP